MSIIDTETKRKLREMGVTALADAFEAQDDLLVGGMPFAERISLIVDDAHASFTSQKIDGLRSSGIPMRNCVGSTSWKSAALIAV